MMNLLVSGLALLLACFAFITYDQVTFRQGLLRTLSAQAQIVGSNSVSALVFNDPPSALTTLSALKNSLNISSAGILTADGHRFAQYTPDGSAELLSIPALPADKVEGYWFRSTHVVLVRKIIFEGKLVGFVYIRADLREIEDRLWKYASIAAVVLLLSLLFAVFISARFRKAVAEPIVVLADTARRVSRDQDYSLRVAAPMQRDELGTLMISFNDMLRQIQQRDAALQKAHDELEQRVAERTRELVSANRELESFSYSVSHDLRGPLDAVSGFSYVLLKHHAGQLDKGGRESLENIRAAAKRMAELIEDLLNLSRVTTSNMHPEPIDLSVFARAILEQLRHEAPQRNVEFVTPERTEAFADARLLRIVMENLLRNAWKYTSHHERARIEFGRAMIGDRAVYFVKDDGSGFDQRGAERLFQPFHRLHSVEEFPGDGIGLATVRRIVERHGGEVWAEGAVEKGATFYFTLGSRRPRMQ